MEITEIANELNLKSKNYEFGKLQSIRKSIKGLKSYPGAEIFRETTISKKGNWAFHYGGRKEMQFNIGKEEFGFRYGLAFSVETSKSMPNIDIIAQKIKIFNILIEERPELFADYKMWHWQGSKISEITQTKKIEEDLIKKGTFIFFGKIMKIENVNVDTILTEFDRMLTIYKLVENNPDVSNKNLKLCVLKPIMWNTNNYVTPSGFKSASGYSQQHGYGHEEWNNNPEWIWKNHRIFHTETKEKLLEYSNNGNLGILMIASKDGNQYAMGLATNVYHNSKAEMKTIAEDIGLYEKYKTIWEIEIVKHRHDNDFEKFISHWKENHTWIGWKCPVENYIWFDNPILLDPKKITKKSKLIGMHGSYQSVLPQNILELVGKEIDNHKEIKDWLLEGNFEDYWVKERERIVSNSNLRKSYGYSGGNKPTTVSFSYTIEGCREIDPLHHILQSQYVKHLTSNGIKTVENENYVDIKYSLNGMSYFCEIKPTKNVPTKYAIRAAIGQLLEYQFNYDQSAKLEIVLSSKPKNKEIEFVASLSFGLKYYDEDRETFISLL